MSVSTHVIRIRLPRDRSFIYLRIDREGVRRGKFHFEGVPRRYYSDKRIEVMSFPTGAPS